MVTGRSTKTWRGGLNGYKQNAANLPTNYDDIHRANLYNKSWKRYRKTQWKA